MTPRRRLFHYRCPRPLYSDLLTVSRVIDLTQSMVLVLAIDRLCMLARDNPRRFEDEIKRIERERHMWRGDRRSLSQKLPEFTRQALVDMAGIADVSQAKIVDLALDRMIQTTLHTD